MTIDDAENYLIALKHCETCEATNTNICKSCPHYRRGTSAKCYDAIDIAVETMRKYQKIQEIYDNWNVDFGVETHRAMSKIGEVLKDDRN